MHHMLEEYYSYIVHCHGHTLLPQYLGLYRLTVNDQETYILVMRNVFSPRLPVHWKYDLKPFLSHPCSRNKSRQKSIGRHQSLHSNRLQLNMTSEVKLPKSGARLSYQPSICDGSAVDREANEKEKSKPLPTLKDNDFLNDVSKLYIGNDAKVKLMDLLEADVQITQEHLPKTTLFPRWTDWY
ncbi:unnamed protein product [Dicrocoelium dendriticum]|nr:unnamed protein product [Dicrocoelium dendriticum]